MMTIIRVILVFILLAGCAAKNDWPVAKSDFDTLHWPEIDTGSVSYHFGSWMPGGVVMKVRYDGQKILSVEVEWIDFLDAYIPMLMESIKGGGAPARAAHRFLVCAMRTEYPKPPSWYEDKPFRSEEFTETTYAEWKQWWVRSKQVDPNDLGPSFEEVK